MSDAAVFGVDMGTTRTRVWLLHGAEVEARASGEFGVRNVAAGESRAWLEARLCELLQEAFAARRTRQLAMPELVLGAGMMTSAQGLAEVPHLAAPAGLAELRAAVVETGLAAWRLRLVPGVRTEARDAFGADVMRGEETLCVGLLGSGLLQAGAALLTLGSHWKWIATDAQGRVAGSSTALTGELIHAVQTHTLLAASLPQHRPERFDTEWLERGRGEARREGLGRALFCVRLLEQRGEATGEQRLSYLYGAILDGELERVALTAPPGQVLISGPAELAEIWRGALAEAGVSAAVLGEAEREAAYLLGLREAAMPR
jgi:2-dehydro-3-deoxygalactonokinase